MSYIIFDLDDTLLTDSKEVTDTTLDVLNRLRALGHPIIINTARSKLFNKPFFDRIQPDYTILNGGAEILDKDGTPIYKCEIPKETVKAMVNELLSMGKNLSLQSDHYVYSNSPTFNRPDVMHCEFENFDFNFDAPKMIISLSQEEAEHFMKKYGLGAITYFGGPLYRFNRKEATKAEANAILAKMLGGSEADIIAFGDDHGDIEMLNRAGIGVLMKNAKPDVYDLVKIKTEYTNNEDGVARFLMKHFGL